MSAALKLIRVDGAPSNFAILPWEDPEDYRALLQSLADEYKPRGPVQQHLVEEVASILWRKRRVGLAEAALYRKGLNIATERSGQVIGRALAHTSVPGRLLGDLAREGHFTKALTATSEETQEELRE